MRTKVKGLVLVFCLAFGLAGAHSVRANPLGRSVARIILREGAEEAAERLAREAALRAAREAAEKAARALR
jgi:hypothetical protein